MARAPKRAGRVETPRTPGQAVAVARSEGPLAEVRDPGADAGRFLARYEKARSARDMSSSLVDACYEFALPLRQRGTMGTKNATPQVDRLFDGTAVSAVQGLASQTLDDVWPADQTPFELKAGSGTKEPEEANRQLADVSAEIIALVNNSDFRSAAHEALLDYTIGTGILVVEAGDASRPLRFRSIPLTEAVLDLGPYGHPDALFIPRKLSVAHIRELWPAAELPRSLTDRGNRDPAAELDVIEGVERDWTARGREVWVRRVVWKGGGTGSGGVLLEERDEGVGACPFLAFSFSRVSGETMGRGPVMMALPDIRTANKLKELMLERADLELAGIWMYDDDGVLNPDTAILEPGALIPRLPGGKGLENLAPSGSGLMADRLLEQLHASIREALYVNDLGDITKTPKSATEIMQRTSDRARRLTGPYGRLLTELLFPLVARVWWLLRKLMGRNDLPPIDGDAIKVRSLSPIVRAQAQDDILRTTNFLQMIQSFYGPQAAMLITDQDEVSRHLAGQIGVNPKLLRTKAAQAQLMQQGMEMAQQAGMVPGGGAAPAAPA